MSHVFCRYPAQIPEQFSKSDQTNLQQRATCWLDLCALARFCCAEYSPGLDLPFRLAVAVCAMRRLRNSLDWTRGCFSRRLRLSAPALKGKSKWAKTGTKRLYAWQPNTGTTLVLFNQCYLGIPKTFIWRHTYLFWWPKATHLANLVSLSLTRTRTFLPLDCV